jgi:hypothetical protein
MYIYQKQKPHHNAPLCLFPLRISSQPYQQPGNIASRCGYTTHLSKSVRYLSYEVNKSTHYISVIYTEVGYTFYQHSRACLRNCNIVSTPDRFITKFFKCEVTNSLIISTTDKLPTLHYINSLLTAKRYIIAYPSWPPVSLRNIFSNISSVSLSKGYRNFS